MEPKSSKTRPFDTKKVVTKVKKSRKGRKPIELKSADYAYSWSNKMERVGVIRGGIPYTAIDAISERINRPVKAILSIMGMPQTTYNKNKKEKSLLNSRDSELILLISELIDYGIEVFNHEEEKFQQWLRKPNLSLGGNTPESLLDTATGIDEVNFCLNRIEFGQFA